MRKPKTYMLIFVLCGLLVFIRTFEHDLFYDPYLLFFRSDYLQMDFPNREILKLTLSTTLRYVLNTVISLGILYVLFKDKSIVKFSTFIYTIAYFILLGFFLYFVIHPRQEDYYLFFNFRRFLIQPLFLILLVPAFYYDGLKN